MMTFAKTTKAPEPNNKSTSAVALLYAGLLVVMIVGQLFSFEKLVPMIESFGLGGGEARATLYASVLVIAEVFALPFLLRMHISVAMRIVSMVMGWVVAGMWLYVMVILSMAYNEVSNIGFAGSELPVPFGLLGICYVLLLVLFTVWASWGMWPVPARSRVDQR